MNRGRRNYVYDDFRRNRIDFGRNFGNFQDKGFRNQSRQPRRNNNNNGYRDSRYRNPQRQVRNRLPQNQRGFNNIQRRRFGPNQRNRNQPNNREFRDRQFPQQQRNNNRRRRQNRNQYQNQNQGQQGQWQNQRMRNLQSRRLGRRAAPIGKINITNLGEEVVNEDLITIFGAYGRLKRCAVFFKDSVSTRTGVVQFYSRACAQRAFHDLNGTLLKSTNISLEIDKGRKDFQNKDIPAQVQGDIEMK